ncbi:MAG: 16S rRNA (uracil(1498)-N(3))-methyltransferase [Armatimonadota bacterium]
MHRFYVNAHLTEAGELVSLPKEVAHQLSRVLRLRPGAKLMLFCGDDHECEAVLETLSPGAATARLLSRHAPGTELSCGLHVAVSALKGEKLDWTVQKLTELGAARITLMQTERTIVAPGEERWSRRLERYARIAQEAAEQSGRVRLPQVAGPLTLAQVLEAERETRRLFLDPWGSSTLAQALQPAPERLTLLIGPEGGFSEAETALAREQGAEPVRLGTRTMRAETAALAAAAAVVLAVDS